MHALSNLAPFRAAHEFFSPAGGDGAPRKKGCILDPILQDTVGPNASAKSDQPPAGCTHDFKAKRSKPWGPSRNAPAAECGLRTRLPRFSVKRRWRVTVARESESASGDEVIQPGDLPRPVFLSTKHSGEHPVDMIDEGQWSVSYTQVSFARE